MGYVYRILNTETNKEYIGSTTNAEKREQTHFYTLKNNIHHNIHLQRSYNKYGNESFIFEIIYEGDDYKDVEYKLINEKYDELYNVSKKVSGGDLISYHPKRSEIVNKMKNTLHELYKDPERRMKHSMPGKLNPNWKGGIDRAKRICSCGNTKVPNASMCFECRNRNGESNPFYGKEHSNETKKKISEIKKQQYLNGMMPTNSNKIEIDGIIYKSQAEAARYLNVSTGTITFRLKSKNFPTYKRL